MRTLIAATITVLVLAGASAPVNAEPRGWGWGGGHKHHYRPHYDNPSAGFWGGVIGGWLGSQMNRDEPEDEPDEIEPWSKAWFAYCARKYKSFDPETGTYLSYEGERRLCK